MSCARLRTLIVEDDEDHAELIRRAIAGGDLEAECRVVATRDEFVSALTEFGPQLILADILLPGFSGTDAVAIAQEWDSTVPAILVSGVQGEELAVTALQSGASDYVLKNRLQVLPSAIERALDRAAQRRALLESDAERRRAEEELRQSKAALESLDRISVAIQGEGELEAKMSAALDAVLSVFECDRAFLMYPCDPDAQTWRTPVERTRPEYPGVLALSGEMPMDPDVAETLRLLLATDGPVAFGPGTPYPLPADVSERFGFKSFMSMALRPKYGAPWQFGIHQCAQARVWTERERHLLAQIGRRLEDGLTATLTLRGLVESERRYRQVFESSPVALVEADYSALKGFFDELAGQGVTDLRSCMEEHPETLGECMRRIEFIDVNNAGLALFGASTKEDVRWGIDRFVVPDAHEALSDELAKVWDGRPGAPADGLLKTLTGELRNVTLEWAICPGYEETLGKVFISLTDVTERERLSAREQALEEQLRQSQKMEAVGQLAGGIAHDFNNLVTAIRGYTELVREELPEEAPLRADVDQIALAADRAADLTRQLLAFSRRQVLQPQVVAPGDVVAGIAPMLRRLLGENIELVTHAASDTGRILVDPSQLEQIIVNLAVNARDAMPAGGRLAVETMNANGDREFERERAELDGRRYVVLKVSDTGRGMDESVRARAFEPFFTTKEQGRGTGMGLATVYGIVRQSGGEVYLHSAVGHGTAIEICLPQAEEEVAGDVASAVPEAGGTAGEAGGAAGEGRAPTPVVEGGGSETILLVEDDAGVRRFTRRSLEGLGYTVIEASNGVEAVALAAGCVAQIDLLLSDMVMPKMGGLEVAERIRTTRPGVRALFMSGFSEDVLGGALHGLESPLLAKPFTRVALSEAVRQALDAERLQPARK